MSRPFGSLPTRYEPDGEVVGTAFVLPGSNTSPATPLLEFARQAALQHSYVVQQLWWDVPDRAEDWSAWAGEQLAAAVAAEPVRPHRVLVIGKSLGTKASPLAAGQSWPAIWFTPLLKDEVLVEGIRANRAAQLLVCGLDDEHHDTATAAALAGSTRTVHEVRGVGHTLWSDNAVRSAEIQLDVARSIEAFLVRLAVR